MVGRQLKRERIAHHSEICSARFQTFSRPTLRIPSLLAVFYDSATMADAMLRPDRIFSLAKSS
jgi:hypothetical protein